MGKTYRNVSGGSCSEDYHSDHNRGFAKKKKRHSHHSLRNKNRNKYDEEYENFNCKTTEKMNKHWAASYYGKLGNVGNMPYTTIKEIEEININNTSWRNNCLPNKRHVENMADNSEDYNNYLKATLKQINRRGKIKTGRNRSTAS